MKGGKGADIFVAQKPVTRSGLTDHMDTVKDFKIGEDKIGIIDFKRIEDLAKSNDGNFELAKSLYLERLTERAETTSRSELELLLKDLNFGFLQIRDGTGDLRFPAWSLVETGRKKRIQDDTVLLRFANFNSEDIDNPFLDVDDVTTIFEFL